MLNGVLRRIGRKILKFAPFIAKRRFTLGLGVGFCAGAYAIHRAPKAIDTHPSAEMLAALIHDDKGIPTLTQSNFKETMAKPSAKLIFLSDSILKPEHRMMIEKVMRDIQKNMGPEIYKLDKVQLRENIIEFLTERKVKIDPSEALEKYDFVLINPFWDYWFWGLDLLGAFSGEDISFELLRFFQGVQVISSIDKILLHSKYPGTVHFVCFAKDPENPESNEKLKVIRKLHTRFSEDYHYAYYWIINNEKLAKKLGIDTAPEKEGDLYMIKVDNENPSVKIRGYPLNCQLIINNVEATKDYMATFISINNLIYSKPLIIQDDIQYFRCRSKNVACNILTVLADENTTDIGALYNMLSNLRKQFPYEETKEQTEILDRPNLLILLSTRQSLPKFVPNNKPGITVRYEKREKRNLFQDELGHIKKFEGRDPAAFQDQAVSGQELQNLSSHERSKAMLVSKDRFSLPQVYELLPDAPLTPESLADFVNRCDNNSYPRYHHQKKAITKYSQKVVGQDFVDLVLNSTTSCIIFFETPAKSKSSNLLECYEQVVSDNLQSHNPSNRFFGRYNTINETPRFKPPEDVPCIGYFPTSDKENPIYLSLHEFQSKSPEDAKKAIQDFILTHDH